MRDTDTITIYWSPASFLTSNSSWQLMYSKPTPVLTELHRNKIPGSLMTQCPATKSLMTNLFSFSSAIDDEFEIPEKHFLREPDGSNRDEIHMEVNSVAGMYHERPSSIEGHIDVIYGMSWLFFADEPVVARMTAPYFPTFTPMEGALLAPGEFDIGRWYRSFNLDYHIPKTTRKFSVKRGDPLFFMEVFTDKKVVFKRYVMDTDLMNITREMVDAPVRYGRHKSLEYRYESADNVGMREIVLSKIKKNLVDEDEPKCPIDHSRQND